MLLWIRHLRFALGQTDNEDQMGDTCNDRVDLISKFGHLLNEGLYLE